MSSKSHKKAEMTLDKQREVWYYNKALDSCITCGGVAHLGERLNGIQEVVGSIPIISTRKKARRQSCFFVLSGRLYVPLDYWIHSLFTIWNQGHECPTSCRMVRTVPVRAAAGSSAQVIAGR